MKDYQEYISLEKFCEELHEQVEEFREMYIQKHKYNSHDNPIEMKRVSWIGEHRMSGS